MSALQIQPRLQMESILTLNSWVVWFGCGKVAMFILVGIVILLVELKRAPLMDEEPDPRLEALRNEPPTD